VPLKANVDEALKKAPASSNVLVVKRTGGEVGMEPGRDVWYTRRCRRLAPDCPPEPK
jgi:acetyl-CoA synthetase